MNKIIVPVVFHFAYVEVTGVALSQEETNAIEPLASSLVYDKRDPFAVSIPLDKEKVWTFARELLINGHTSPTVYGDGDVKIHTEHRGIVTCFHLRAPSAGYGSPESAVHIRAFTVPVKRFCDQMLALVPAGEELAHINLDQEISVLLR